MQYHSARRLLAGLGASLAVAAVSVATISTPASAAINGLDVYVRDVTVATGSAGARSYVVVYAAEETETTELSVVFDTAKLAGVASVAFEPDPWLTDFVCETAGTLTTCTYKRDWPIVLGSDGLRVLDYTVVPDANAALDATGTLAYTLTVDGDSLSGTSKVTVGEGVDLITTATNQTVRGSGTPGDSLSLPMGVRNAGGTPVDGAVLYVGGYNGLRLAQTYSNCFYRTDRDSLSYCEFDRELAAGAEYSAELTLELDEATQAPGESWSLYQWYTPSDWTDQLSWYERRGLSFAKGSGSTLALEQVVSARRAQTDVNPAGNGGNLIISVTGDNPVDLAALGAEIKGEAGTTHEVEVGIRNAGNAMIDESRPGLPAAKVVVRIPEGTTAAAVDDNCGALTGETGEPIPGSYVCRHPEYRFLPGEEVFFDFTLKIDKKIANAAGTVTLNDEYLCRTCADANAQNDVAYLLANGDGTLPPPGGNGGEGGGGGGGTLPVTGPQTGMIGAAGAALLALGVGVFLLARRRRTSFVA